MRRLILAIVIIIVPWLLFAEGVFTVTQYNLRSCIETLDGIESAISQPASYVANHGTKSYSQLAFASGDVQSYGVPHFYSDMVPLPIGIGSSGCFAIKVTGTINIPEAGYWTFAFGSDDGFRVTIRGHGILEKSNSADLRCLETTLHKVDFQEPGEYYIRLVWFSRGYANAPNDVAGLEVSIAQGEYTSFNAAAFKLLRASSKGVSCEVCFNGNGGYGNKMDVQVFECGKEQKLSKNTFLKDGYVFQGWATNITDAANGIWKYRDEAEISVDHDMTLFAVWANPALTLTAESADWSNGSITLCCTDGDTSGASHTYTLFYYDDNLQVWNVVDSARNKPADVNGKVLLTDTGFASRLGGIPPVRYCVIDNVERVSAVCETRNRHGIFVGVGKFAKDANSMKKLAIDNGEFSGTIRLLTSPGAKYNDVKNAFEDVAHETKDKPGDICVIYFSTHGGRYNNTTIGRLVLDDRPPVSEDPKKQGYHEGLLAKHIRLLDPDKKGVGVVCIISACYSGSFLDDDNGLEECNEVTSWCHREDLGGNVAWITAANAETTANAIFTDILLDYGWKRGWALKDNKTTMSFLDLFDCAKRLYNPIVKKLEMSGCEKRNEPVLRNVIAGNADAIPDFSLVAPGKPVGLSASKNRSDVVRIEWTQGAGGVPDEYIVIRRFKETGKAESIWSGIKNNFKELPEIASPVYPMQYAVAALNGAGVAITDGFEEGWRKINVYSVTFDSNLARLSLAKIVKYMEADSSLTEELRKVTEQLSGEDTGGTYEFMGWKASKTDSQNVVSRNFDGSWNIPNIIVNGDLEYYADWVAKRTNGMTQNWLDGHQTIATASNGDVARAAAMTAANGCRTVGECYALGIDPEDPNDDLMISGFRMKDGKPMITLNHTEDGSGNSFASRIRTLGKKSLMDAEWVDITDMDQSEYRFFKVAVELDDGGSGEINMDDFVIEQGVLQWYSGDADEVVIPSSVTSIGSMAFSYHYNLSSVTIPYGVTSIGEFAFLSNTNLASVTIADSVTNIEMGAFAFCEKLVDVTIPEGLASISYGAFAYCYELASITIPAGVTNIGYGAFADCRSLTNVTFKGNAPNVVSNSFDGVGVSCTVHVNRGSSGWGVAIPGTWNGMRIEYVDDGSGDSSPANDDRANAETLSGASGTRSFSTVNATVESGEPIVLSCEDSSASVWFKWTAPTSGKATFSTAGSDFDTVLGVYRYDTLAEVAFNDDSDDRTSSCSFLVQAGQTYYVVVAGYDGSGAAALSWECVEGGTPTFTIEDGVLTAVELNGAFEVTIPGTVWEIGESAFEGCEDLMSVVMSNGVAKIDDYAFYNCSSLESVTLPYGLMSMGKCAFAYCHELAAVTVPEGVTNVGYRAFYSCDGLTSVALPRSLASIGDEAFAFCGGIGAFTVSDDNPAYKVQDGMLLTKNGGVLLHGADGDVSIPSGVTRISNGAFASCVGLTNVTIPTSVTSISSYAFSGCGGLTNVEIPNSVQYIGKGVFQHCRGLADEDGFVIVRNVLYDSYGDQSEVEVPQGVVKIDDNVFAYRSDLTKVTIPSSVSSIGAYLFRNSSNLTNVTFEGNAPTVNNYSFVGVGSSCTVYVNRGSSGWNVTIPGTWNGLPIRYKEGDE